MLLAAALNTAALAYAPEDLKGHWAEGAAYTMLQKGVMTAAADGGFHPNDAISRTEAAAALAQLNGGLAAQLRQGSGNTVTRGEFAQALEHCLTLRDGPVGDDVPPPPQENEIPAAAAGSVDRQAVWAALPAELRNQLKPELWELFSDDDWRSWAEQYGRKTAANAAGTSGPAPFSDVSGHPASSAVRALWERNVVTGSSNGMFRPDAPITRGETAMMLFRALKYPAETPEYAPLPDRRVIEVPYLSQLTPVYAPVGCEPTALLMGLKGLGYATDVDLYTFLSGVPTTQSDPAKGFVGSPFRADPTKKTRTTIYPAKLAEYGSQFGPVRDISGSTVEQLQNEVLSGHPVVAYVTMWWEKPFYRTYQIEGTSQRLLSNNHAVLVCGYDRAAQAYYVADPYNQKALNSDLYYWIDAATFEPLYLERCHALAVGN